MSKTAQSLEAGLEYLENGWTQRMEILGLQMHASIAVLFCDQSPRCGPEIQLPLTCAGIAPSKWRGEAETMYVGMTY